MEQMKQNMKKDGIRFVAVLVAAVLMAVSIKTFVRMGGLYPGGVTGVSVLIQRIAEMFLHVQLPYSLINITLNAIPVYIGFRFIGKKFTLYSLLMIVASSVFVDLLPELVITSDTLLIAIFGGIINGAAISLCLSVDATSGGTDFIAIFLSQRKGMDSFNLILLLNVCILAAAGLIFGWDKALYSIIFQYASTQVLHLLYRNYQQQTLFIVTDYPDEVAALIHRLSHHGATILDAHGSYRHDSRPVVYSVIASSDSRRTIKAIRDLDPKAFINSMHTTELKGNFYLKPKD
ncbi:Uncharacterized membrane-anchored protein YitT, contains DUF161 and DUF2179 domains [Lachnospiraceae bacterium NK3A20]|nr:Uncharacterized membrane-anchored protein YitT, contains DUF161 and DUF2179 domains [Lachnospiraceae bacterium NK3A20]